jgi:hypothetical protein
MELMSETAFSLMAAITFSDVIVANVPLTDDILFHELVHAQQYRQLGVEGFAEAYVKGALERGSYNGIPLEEQAYIHLGESPILLRNTHDGETNVRAHYVRRVIENNASLQITPKRR